MAPVEVVEMRRERRVEETERTETGALERNIPYIPCIDEETAAEVVQKIWERGYEIKGQSTFAGSGAIRDAIRLTIYRDGLEKDVIVKIPKKDSEVGSINARINMTKRDLEASEIMASNGINHSNIITIYDTFVLHDGRRVNIEEDFRGESLEDLVKRDGPLKQEGFEDIFGQVINAVKYLNIHKGILHRDITPANIIVKEEEGKYHVKLTDFQNSARTTDIQELVLPTRGGTEFTHPRLLNALFNDLGTGADLITEAYGVSGAMLFGLKGECPFKYKLEEVADGETGIEVPTNSGPIIVTLSNNGSRIDSIEPVEHEKTLRRVVRGLPRKYRKVIYSGMTLTKREYKDILALESDFNRVKGRWGDRIARKALKSIKPAIISAAITGTLIGAGITLKNNQGEKRPTLVEMLQKEDYREFSLESLNQFDREYMLKDLYRHFKRVEGEASSLERRTGIDAEEFANFANNIHYMDERICSSWLRACLMADKKSTLKLYNNKREWPSYVPRQFEQVNDRLGVGFRDNNVHIAFGIRYLKLCFDPDSNVADTLARYFCTSEEINTAIARSESKTYFAKADNGDIQIGYGQLLPYEKQEIINTAIALYLTTDNYGKIDYKKLRDLKKEASLYQGRQEFSLPAK